MEPMPFDGKTLKLKETDENTVIFKGKEIERGEMPGDLYLKKVEETVKNPLKSCINCRYFEFTPLSVNMGYAFKGKCTNPKNKDKARIPGHDYIVSIFHLCGHFDFSPIGERIDAMKKKLESFHKALERGAKK